MNVSRLRIVCLVAGASLTGLVVSAGVSAPPEVESLRAPLHVEVDRMGRMHVDGAAVDTLLVQRRQIIYWEKRDKDGPDLTIQFERRLFRVRYRLRVVISDAGRPRFTMVNIHARMRVYEGTPEKGFVDRVPEDSPLLIRVVAPPAM